MRPTLLVRKIMQSFGCDHVYTNRYDSRRPANAGNCHTVKCYQSNNTKQDLQMCAAITTALTQQGIKHDIKFRDGARNPWTPATIIVRLPLQPRIPRTRG